MKVVIDTNIVISGSLWGGTPGRILRAFSEDRFENFTTLDIISEIQITLQRDKFKKRLQYIGRTAEQLTLWYAENSTIVEPTILPEESCRDPKDVKFLACAKAVPVDVIISGDKDLLELSPFEAIEIATPADFIAKQL